ncbi:TPA: hypothetical protein ACQZFA_001146 [Escherichia coli]
MAKILGISRSKVSWFIAELERRKWVEVTRSAIYSTMEPVPTSRTNTRLSYEYWHLFRHQQ